MTVFVKYVIPINVDISDQKKELTTATPAHLRRRAGYNLQFAHKFLRILQRTLRQRVVDPATVATVGYKSSFFEHLEMKRKARLSGVERIHQVADASLTITQTLQNAEAGSIGERVEETRGLFSGGGNDGHGKKHTSVY